MIYPTIILPKHLKITTKMLCNENWQTISAGVTFEAHEVTCNKKLEAHIDVAPVFTFKHGLGNNQNITKPKRQIGWIRISKCKLLSEKEKIKASGRKAGKGKTSLTWMILDIIIIWKEAKNMIPNKKLLLDLETTELANNYY